MMCGIAGIFAFTSPAALVDSRELGAISDAMSVRGPDGQGDWYSPDGRVGFAHRRLAIIDTSPSGAQPMSTGDGRLTITFNGEIYNYRAIRARLEAKGVQFKSESDTEVLLHLYAERGPEMLGELRGMYAFAIWDSRTSELFLARDPFGIKPLYYSSQAGAFKFASQVKALQRASGIDLSPSPPGVVGFFVWGAVPDPFTIFKGISAVGAGTYMLVDRTGIATTRRFYQPAEQIRLAGGRQAEPLQDTVRNALLDSVRHHLVADVPVGIFLSSGVDSTTLASIAKECGSRDLRTITLGFPEFRGTENDEVPLAERVAKELGARHETHYISREDFESEFDRILASMDQPSIDGVNTFFVSRAAASNGLKVALSGIGGDELFGGYPGFRQIPRLVRFVSALGFLPRYGSAIRRGTAPILRNLSSPKLPGLIEYGQSHSAAYLLRRAVFMPWELNDLLDEATVRKGLEELRLLDVLEATAPGMNPRQTITALEFEWYLKNQLLRDADWAGMANSVEIRTPFVDVEFFRSIAPTLALENPPSKRELSRSASVLPEGLLSRPKTGFVTPIDRWIALKSGIGSTRGLRGWAKRVYFGSVTPFKALGLVTDAFGGRGGIGKFNRDLLTAVSKVPTCAEVVGVPRLILEPIERLPPRVTFDSASAGGKARFVWRALRWAWRRDFDVVLVGHVHLSPIGLMVSRLRRVPAVLFIHGIDAWTPPRSRLARYACKRMDRVIAVSEVTLQRFTKWAPYDRSKLGVLPNSVNLSRYMPGNYPSALAARLGVEGRKILMTLGRLDSFERYKGFDEVLEVMPTLIREYPDLAYLIGGDGNDRQRLEAKVKKLGLERHVVFTGFVPEGEKVDFYRLADAFLMPSRGEGFGIVILEALATGTPVVGSILDGTREALRDGLFGILVDPEDTESVANGIRKALGTRKGVPEGLDYFSIQAFDARVRDQLSAILPRGAMPEAQSAADGERHQDRNPYPPVAARAPALKGGH